MDSISLATKKRPRSCSDGEEVGGTQNTHVNTDYNSFFTPVDRPSKKVALVQPSTGQFYNQSRRKRFKSLLPTRRRFRRQGTIPSLGDADRFIPNRDNIMNLDLCQRMIVSDEQKKLNSDETPEQRAFSRLLRSTLCNIPINKLDSSGGLKAIFSFGVQLQTKENVGSVVKSEVAAADLIANPFTFDSFRTVKLGRRPIDGIAAARLAKAPRKVFPKPYKTLGAYGYNSDFYLNLISWSKDNVIAVAIDATVHIYRVATERAVKIFIASEGTHVTSLSFCQLSGYTHHLAVGTSDGWVTILDILALEEVTSFHAHDASVYSLAWNHRTLTSGGDGKLLNHDLGRSPTIVTEYVSHRDIVCGLAWNGDCVSLASGSNDYTVCVWDSRFSGPTTTASPFPHATSSTHHMPRFVLREHTAATKALDWCPFDRHVLASAGGASDRSIKFWNTINGKLLNSVGTGSQVCALNWNMHQREIVSSHGYMHNKLVVWKYPDMTKIQELKGHTGRVLSTAYSPDGNVIVSAAADEALNFWQINDVKAKAIVKSGISGALVGAPTIR